ncbi:transferrin receptor [Aaosphaeria arxii CBS 175.79]|uniref:Peptide hydrolase n=1 Tax=Aaosphaeria arxii CBS 175.79 TaxID=1450172 RepID=A0A6A5Y6K3_9PLEO|nr:transferrin receptor [Aaosphaeria arxii CBS 175.79]KAF2020440.1 transferrin receptor [Aaosphaeria arxii CBS 175.79]
MRFSTIVHSLSVASALGASIPKRNEELFTLKFSAEETSQVTAAEKWKLLKAGKRFVDITNHADFHAAARKRNVQTNVTFPSAVHYEESVNALLPRLNKTNMESVLKPFSEFYNRWFNNTNGKESSEWLYSQVQAIINSSEAKGADVRFFKHDFPQSSIIATIPGKSNNTIVIGSHQDTISLDEEGDPGLLRHPGADDDGSGVVTILEAFRVLLSDPTVASGRAENTLEFHWYAAEEPGLLGSQAVFENYKNNSRAVKAMLQQDMTGYVKNGTVEQFGLITDHVSVPLTEFIKLAIDAYCDIPYVEDECGYGCSDHSSALDAGYPSAFVFESAFNDHSPYIHSANDTIESVNFDHALQHAKLVVGFAYELGFTANL